jgi:hypothetical protein
MIVAVFWFAISLFLYLTLRIAMQRVAEAKRRQKMAEDDADLWLKIASTRLAESVFWRARALERKAATYAPGRVTLEELERLVTEPIDVDDLRDYDV